MKTLTKSIVVYKGARTGKLRIPVLIVLEIPKGAKCRINPSTQQGLGKNRASAARVLSIESVDGTERYDTAFSTHDPKFVYRVGKLVKPKDFATGDASCAGGIHFYLRRREALGWVNIDPMRNDTQYSEGRICRESNAGLKLDNNNLQTRVSQLEIKLTAVRRALG